MENKGIKITERKQEIIELISKGYNLTQIAEKLIISRHTVKAHVTELFNKLGINSQCELVTWGFRNGILK